ncbi:Shedu anti-phage system protein SduA domain-containing protein [Singulisphaera sp. PoT]|uniref:Shedu anti-phage system protein SduA domain-containing protein n=1 Tax=Singulisphaera sp. PoT TaxID=3411797 RepID=UPI003BF5D5D2
MAIKLEWQALLADQKATEPSYLRYIRENAGFFLCDSQRSLISISELQFGADYRPDFVVATDEASYGFKYELIELESPHDIVYKKSVDPSAHLTEAINQVQKWQLWLDANRAEAKRLFPSKQFQAFDKPNFDFLIIIGRREALQAHLHMRNYNADSLSIRIRSFDYLTDRLFQRYFYSLPFQFSDEMNNLSPILRNKLVNPFAKSFTSGEWRGITGSFQLNPTHMVAKNADLLILRMKYNDRLSSFMLDWDALPDDEKNRYWEAIRIAHGVD